MADDYFGWDLTYKSVENDLRKKEDLLIAFTHWFIIKNGFSCIGNGDSKTVSENEVRGETLSPGWNQNEDYNIRYLHGDKLYLLRASITGRDVILNFLRAEDLGISSCVFKVDNIVKELKGNINTIMPDNKNVLSILRKELIEPVFISTTHSATGTQTTEKRKSSPPSETRQDPFSPDATNPLADPLSVPIRRPVPSPLMDPLWTNPIRDPMSVGVSDLDPFSTGVGGGMLYDPLNPRPERNIDPFVPGPSNPRGLPRGAVPPGARFDPFGPPGHGGGRSGNRRIDPDPDHLPPPGYDDMFIDDGPPEPAFNQQNPQGGRGRGRGRRSDPTSEFNDPSI